MLHVDKYSIWQIQINATRQSALSDLEKIRNIFDKYQLEFLKFHKNGYEASLLEIIII